MVLEEITREEFDKRFDAANKPRTQELLLMEERQADVEQLLSSYERTLDEIESELDKDREGYGLSCVGENGNTVVANH